MHASHFQEPEPLRPDGDVGVHPVPEHRADAALGEIYRDLKATFGVPWVGVITQAVAHYRPFFAQAWGRFAGSARTHGFERRCDAIRLLSWQRVGASFPMHDQGPRLRALGYSERELAQIRAVLDAFDYGNPKYLVLATAIKEGLLTGNSFGGGAVDALDRLPRAPLAQTEPIPVMVEEHHAGESLAALYADLKRTLQLPFVNSDYKAMARWPSYLQLAWSDLKPCIGSPAYGEARRQVHALALAAVDGLPVAYHMGRQQALQAGLSPDQVDELVQVIRLFQWLLSGLVLNVTYFKQALGEAGAGHS